MQNRLPPYFRHSDFGIEPADVVRLALGCEPAAIQKRVVVTPIWRSNLGALEESYGVTVVPDKVWNLDHKGQPVTVIRSGIGAPNTGDVVLALACTACELLIFTGSVGGLSPELSIGDFVVVEKSVSADGFVRYLSDQQIPADRFLTEVLPDKSLTSILSNTASDASKRHHVGFRSGAVVSVDTIVAQFIRIDRWVSEHSLLGVEMETAATFEAARLCGIRAAALLQVSDVIPTRKTLFSGRTESDRQRRQINRRTVLPEIVLGTLVQMET